MSQITDELLPCRRCGQKEGCVYANDGWFSVECDNCPQRTSNAHRSAQSAIAEWNRRSTPPVGAETGEPVAWLHEPTGNVFKDGECQALIKAWQKQFADTMSPEEIASDFVPLVRASPAVPNTVTAEMIERAQKGYRKAGEKRNWQASWPDDDAMHEILTAALAQEAGE